MGGSLQKPAKKEKKDSASLKPSSSKKKSRDGDEDGSKKRKTKRKKDPNAPKKAKTGFIFFSQAEREVKMTTDTIVSYLLKYIPLPST